MPLYVGLVSFKSTLALDHSCHPVCNDSSYITIFEVVAERSNELAAAAGMGLRKLGRKLITRRRINDAKEVTLFFFKLYKLTLIVLKNILRVTKSVNTLNL